MTVRIRASSIASIIDCPLRGLSIALGLVKPLPSTAPAAIGTAVHASTAAFDHAIAEGYDAKADDTAEVAVDLICKPEEEVDWGRVSEKEALRRALGVHTRYCTDIAPAMTYTEIELDLAPFTVSVEGVEIELTGTLDRVCVNPLSATKEGVYKHGIADLKTGARACSQSPGKHKGQLAVYELLYENTTGQACELEPAILQLQTSAEYQVDVKTVQNARDSLVGDGEQIGYLHHIARMLKSGDFIGNPSSWLCSEKYCPLHNSCIFK